MVLFVIDDTVQTECGHNLSPFGLQTFFTLVPLTSDVSNDWKLKHAEPLVSGSEV